MIVYQAEIIPTNQFRRRTCRLAFLGKLLATNVGSRQLNQLQYLLGASSSPTRLTGDPL